jgi:GTP-binding protein
MAGRDAEDVTIVVPVGTMVYDDEDNELLVDLSADGMTYVVARGGRGGRGNKHFTNSVRQAPAFAENGAPGESFRVRLELKLLADVGLIGLPNAGKSTLIGACSAARPKIGDYPFTTIIPNLGVVRVGHESFTMADMPGLIEGASEGLGLGHQFLKHVERTRVLIHVVDAFPIDGSEPWDNFRIVEQELANYSEELASRPRLIALNKVDLAPDPEFVDLVKEPFVEAGYEVFPVSGATNQGLEPLLFRAAALIDENVVAPAVPVLKPAQSRKMDDKWEVREDDGEFFVEGARIERLVHMTNLTNKEALRYLHRKLERIGVIDALREAGATDGDTVVIAGWAFAFRDWGS